MAGVDNLKIGFVCRKNLKKVKVHKIVEVNNVSPDELIKFFKFDMNNAFSCLKVNLDHLCKVDGNGSFVYNKMAYKNNFKFFSVPDDDEDGEEEEGEEEGNEEDAN